ncbi:hypothetical protein L596_008458 [Steinernema carpocapsae]|uniref:Saposin B-type domain-containing protein n=1 Tax=Steinernema carpocapsae TaxID=34508 RepID=A0A4U5PCU2_STECR|nr:hypothetical protein L596_008458 [Steinernema carpocapsae]
MFAARGTPLLLLLLVAFAGAFTVEECKEVLKASRKRVRFMAENLVPKEHADQHQQHNEILEVGYASKNPTRALFQGEAAGDPGNPHNCPPDNTTFSNPLGDLGGGFMQKSFSLFHVHPSADPFVWFVSTIHDALSKEGEVCNGPEFKSLNSITEEQVLGFASAFIANDAKDICSLCHHVVDHVRPKLIEGNILLHADDEIMFRKIVSSRLPSTRAICSTFLPACYDHYHYSIVPPSLKNNASELTKCAACPLCMTAATLLEHKFLLVPEHVKVTKQWAQETVFHQICSAICRNEKTYTAMPSFKFGDCIKTMGDIYDMGIQALHRLAMPNQLCALTLGFCKPNDTPNLLHCMKPACDAKNDTIASILQLLLGDLCKKVGDLPKDFLERFNIPEKEYEKTLQRMRMFDEL